MSRFSASRHTFFDHLRRVASRLKGTWNNIFAHPRALARGTEPPMASTQRSFIFRNCGSDRRAGDSRRTHLRNVVYVTLRPRCRGRRIVFTTALNNVPLNPFIQRPARRFIRVARFLSVGTRCPFLRLTHRIVSRTSGVPRYFAPRVFERHNSPIEGVRE